jgi:hypothetical protein
MGDETRVHYLINYLNTLNDLYEKYPTESIDKSIGIVTSEIENILIEKK